MTTNNLTSPNHFLQANLASVLAIIPSYLTFTFMPEQIMHAFDLWRESLQLSIRYDVLLGMCIYWWMPALLIFILMRYTHFDQWLKVNLLAHLSILAANLFLLLIVGLTVYQNNHMYGMSIWRDEILFSTLSFAAMLTIGNMLWHYVIAPNPKLRAWLTDDVVELLLK